MDDFEYEEFEDNDPEVRELKLRRFKHEGLNYKKGLCLLIEKEMKENEIRMMKSREKGKNVVVASDDETTMQQSCCTTSSSAKWSDGSPLLIEPLAWVSPPTKKRTSRSLSREQQGCSSSREGRWSPDSLLVMERWVRHSSAIPTTKQTSAVVNLKNRMIVMEDNIMQEQRTKKRKCMKIETEEEPQQLKEERKNKIMKMNRKQLPQPSPTPGVMPINLQQAITALGGTTPMWLTEKKLTVSDTTRQLGRLLFPPCGDVLENYLTDEEKEKLANPIGLSVMVVDASGEQFEVDFKFWVSLDKYVFVKNWKEMVERLSLIAELDIIQLWCFRLPAEGGSKLCFATNVDRGHHI